MNVYVIELSGADGIYDVIHVAANNREEAVGVLTARSDISWYDVFWVEGATYETDTPCVIETRLCTEDGQII